MKKVALVALRTFPQVAPEDRRCPRCGSKRVHGHGRRWRRVRDWQHGQVMLQRLRCVDCGATWSVYPQGVNPGVRFSLRAEQAMVLLYLLGLSYRHTAAFMHGLRARWVPARCCAWCRAKGCGKRWPPNGAIGRGKCGYAG